MNSLTLYTIKNSEGKFYFPTMGGSIAWSVVPDYTNAARDRNQAAGWLYRLSQRTGEQLEIAELTITW